MKWAPDKTGKTEGKSKFSFGEMDGRHFLNKVSETLLYVFCRLRRLMLPQSEQEISQGKRDE